MVLNSPDFVSHLYNSRSQLVLLQARPIQAWSDGASLSSWSALSKHHRACSMPVTVLNKMTIGTNQYGFSSQGFSVKL